MYILLFGGVLLFNPGLNPSYLTNLSRLRLQLFPHQQDCLHGLRLCSVVFALSTFIVIFGYDFDALDQAGCP